MQTSLRRIAEKAKQNKHYQFGNLYGMLNKSALYCAWKGLNKKAAAGVDKETAGIFSKDLTVNLDTLGKNFAVSNTRHGRSSRSAFPRGMANCGCLDCRNPRHPSLRSKKIQGIDGIFEACVDMDIRMTWQYTEDGILLRKIGELTRR